MEPAKTIDPPDWMRAPETQAVMKALGPHDPLAPKALFVGGCVRNLLLGLPVADLDIATILNPEQVMESARRAGLKAVPTGLDHGTVTLVSGGTPYEITTLRRDVSTDGRRASVAFTGDWVEDAARRDFTMNTLLAGADGRIYDPLGQGLSDLQARRVVFVGDPDRRIAEDYLRILRFFRFHLYYGAGAPDAAGLAACRAGAHGIDRLSRERVTQELFKIIAADKPVDVLSIMFRNSILSDLPHPDYKPLALKYYCALEKQYRTGSHIAPRLLLLAGLDNAHFRRMESRLIQTGAIKKEAARIMDGLRWWHTEAHERIKWLIAEYPDVAAQVRLLDAVSGDASGRSGENENGNRIPAFARMTDEGMADREQVALQADMAMVAGWTPPAFPVTGEDVLAAGIEKGPAIGQTLADLRRWWMEQDFKPGKSECLKICR